MNYLLVTVIAVFFLSCSEPVRIDEAGLSQARENAELANEGFRRCMHFVEGWLAHADPETGLIPRNLTQSADIWNAQDSAADNYPFMVLSAAICDRPLFEGRMLDMLRTETRLTSRLGALPDTYSFSKKAFAAEEPDLGAILFGSSEYIKDGLLPLTEWLGESPWSERMIAILDDMWDRAPVETPFGAIVSESHEINGEMLQTLSRVHFMTGERKYLEWAVRLGDYYLLGDHHPTRDAERLRLRDHGCEIVSGLCELYATVNFALPEKKSEYRAPLYEMLDTILEKGRNEDGLFYNEIDPRTGDVIRPGVADTWGYTLNGYYTVYLVDGHVPYRQAALKALGVINERYRSYAWEGTSSDGYADAIESALNLYNREAVESAAHWIDSETQVMWAKQQPDGVIEGWHGDGNFARTTIMYCLWKTKGITARPWRDDLKFGAVETESGLAVLVSAVQSWQGELIFDRARHTDIMGLPVDWPRINQFPEWFAADPESHYEIRGLDGGRKAVGGAELIDGLSLSLDAGGEILFIVTESK